MPDPVDVMANVALLNHLEQVFICSIISLFLNREEDRPRLREKW